MRAYVEDRGKTHRGARWRARHEGPDGRLRSRSFNRKVDADRFIAEHVARTNRGDWVDPDFGQRRLEDWLREWDAARLHLRDSSRVRDRHLIKVIVRHLGDLPLAAVTAADLRRMVSALSMEGRAPATIRKTYQIAAAALQAASRDRLILRNPAEGIDLPRDRHREMTILEPPQVADLMTEIGPCYRGMVALGAYGGLRIGEVGGLFAADINFLRATVTVQRTLTDVGGRVGLGATKTGASRRTIHVPRFVIDEIGVLLASKPVGPAGLVFTAPRGGPIRLSTWRRRVWQPAAQRAGLVGVKFHDLRHTHVAWLIADGAHPKAIQVRVGHASITTTLNTYGHLMKGMDEQLVEGLESRAAKAAAPSPRPETKVVEAWAALG